MTMTESSIDNITQQARQGSVAAIIQVLNDRLAGYGVRTRAVLAQGILQLLCEADTTDRLEQDNLVSQIRQILGSLRPRHIRRVRINSRIVKEQQLLWLDEIQRDPKGQLLWTEEISLPRPNLIQLLVEDLTASQKQSDRIVVNPSSSRSARDRRQFARGILGGTGLSLLLILLGWAGYRWLSANGKLNFAQQSTAQSGTSEVVDTLSSSASQSESAPVSNTTPDDFAQAVWLAQQAVEDGQRATTSAEWLELASRWQRASDLMGNVSPDDERYATAQDRQALYQANSEEALKQASLHQVQQP